MAYSFTVGFYDSMSLMPLHSGVPLAGKVNPGESVFYTYSPPNEAFKLIKGKKKKKKVWDTTTIEITLTALAGNPDILVSTNGRLPSLENYVKIDASANLGKVTLLVEAEYGKSVNIQVFGADAHLASEPEMFGIYSLVATAIDYFQPVQLLSGQAQHGYVPQDSVRHYYFETSAKVDQYAVLLPH